MCMRTLIADGLVPAQPQADITYAGVYRTAESANVSFSITIIADDEEPGMSVTAFASDGTDVRAAIAELNGVEASALTFSLYPISLASQKAPIDMKLFSNALTPLCLIDVRC